MLGPRHPYTEASTMPLPPASPAWPCGQCGLPRANEVHDLPASPALDGRQAAAGEAVKPVGERGLRVASWSNPVEDSLTLTYDADQLAADGRPVVDVLVNHQDGTFPGTGEIVIPLDALEEMVASIRRRVDGS